MYMDELRAQVRYPVIDTPLGKVMGIIKDNVYIFRGIPYATARRFHFPEPVKSWGGVHDATAYGPVCPEIQTTISPGGYLVASYYMPQDENCHYANVWTSSVDTAAKKPVMVWFHGGGWTTGSSVEQYAYDGESLAAFGDVVVVSVNHRLNCLGYMDLSAYGEEYARSGLCGVADLVEALKWVRNNIAAFGGDPDCVTIMGQSGGGSKVFAVMQTPAADGLYHRAIIQSGGVKFAEEGGKYPLRELSRRMGVAVAEKLGLTKENITEIEKVPYWYLAEAVKAAQEELGAESGNPAALARWEPSFDNDYSYDNPCKIGFRQETAGIPMLTCSVLGESHVNFHGMKDLLDEEGRYTVVKSKYRDRADALIEAFQDAYPDHNIADIGYIDLINRPRLKALSQKRSMEGPVWNAVFTLNFPIRGGYTAWHCAEIPYVFHNATYMQTQYIPGVTERVEDQMAGAWAAFARNGDPNHAGIPYWPQVGDGPINTMIFDEETRLGVDHDAKLYELLMKK